MRVFKSFLILIFTLILYSPLHSYALEPIQTVPVEVGGIHILDIQHGVGSFSPQDRATAIVRRIESRSKDKIFDASSITTEERENATDIVAGDLTIVSLTHQDALDAKKPRQSLAAEVSSAVKDAIQEERKARSPRQLATSIAFAGATTLLLILLLFALRASFPRLYATIKRARGKTIKPLRIRTLDILSAERITDTLVWLAQSTYFLLTLTLFYVYVPLVLSYFPWTANFAPKIFHFILNPIKKIAIVFYDYVPNLFFILVAIFVTRYVLRFIRLFFDAIAKGGLQFEGFHKEWADPTYKLVRMLVLAFALIVIFPYLPGSGSPAFQGVSVFLGILFSMGSSASIGNIVSGIVLTYMRPFNIGDRVKIADTIGDVVEKNLLVTRIRTIKNVDVTIPNAMILSSHMINYSSSALTPGLILHTTVTIGYDTPWNQVHELLCEAAGKTEEISATPGPFILQTSLDDFYVSYELNAYTTQPNRMAATYSSLHANIQDAFNRAGVEIMSPHYSAIRDGNETTVPAAHRARDYIPSSFRFESREPDRVP
jgi:small-conductance mechanosensitive channel